MDGNALFRKLGVGAKFDFKRFRKDAESLKLSREPIQKDNVTRSKRKLDDIIFSQNKKLKAHGSEESDSCSESEESSSDEEENVDNTPRELHILGNITASEENPPQKSLKKKKIKSADRIAAIKQEEINHIRKKNRIHFQGTDVPEPLTSFRDLGIRYSISEKLLQNIEAVGYMSPTPIQIQAIPTMMERREIMACAPTGSGKTAAFIIPVLHYLQQPKKEGFRALVLAPTRELAKQIKREFQRLSEGMGFKILFIENASTAAKKLASKSGKRVDILVSTPNRLIYMLKEDPPVLDLSNIQWLVIDESDKLFEEGRTGFREQLAQIYKVCDNRNVRRAMFSATFAYDVEQWCKLNLDNVVHIYIGGRNCATQTIEQELLFVGQESGKLLAMRDMVRKGVEAPVLVFVQSKDRAKELFQEMAYDGMNVDIIHSDRRQAERDTVVTNFRSGKVWMLICTELMGRGIDFKGVNLVINFDFPTSAISYIHRIGRTGRAGRPGRAVTFFTESDSKNLRSIANIMVEAGCPVPQYMLKMRRPNKKVRKKLEKRVPKRPSISAASQIRDKKFGKKKGSAKNWNQSKDGKDQPKNKTKKSAKTKIKSKPPREKKSK